MASPKPPRIAIIGSGPSGVAAASVLLSRGFRVDVLDGGRGPSPKETEFARDLTQRVVAGRSPTQADRRFLTLGSTASHPFKALARTAFTLAGSGIDPKLVKKRILGSTFVFDGVDQKMPLFGMPLARSLAPGGLSNAWGAACYPLRPTDYDQWPLSENDLAPWYALASDLAQVDARVDSLINAYPLYSSRNENSDSDAESRAGLEALFRLWNSNSSQLAANGIIAGRSRLAVNSTQADTYPCVKCGLCFYGCPTGAIWSSTRVLEELHDHPRFSHMPGHVVSRIRESHGKSFLIVRHDHGEDALPTPYDAVLLAAGPISSLLIAADTLEVYDVERRFLENDMFVVPFRPTSLIELPSKEPEFSLSEAVIALDPGFVSRYPTHVQMYRITDPLLGPLKEVLCSIPASIRRVVLRVAQRYLVAFIYLNSKESRRGHMTVHKRPNERSQIRCSFSANPDGKQLVGKLISHIGKQQHLLGIAPIPRLLQDTPPGFSCHFGGTLPMRPLPRLLESAVNGLLQGTRDVYVIDSSVTPAVPAQNFTLTLMANAMRVAAGLSEIKSHAP